jgi:transcriptional regulator GlxA family with amidase domain
MSPMSYVNDARIDVAKHYLESTDLSYKEITPRCGLESVEALRRIFVRRLNITPPNYRQRFRSADQASRSIESGKPGAV